MPVPPRRRHEICEPVKKLTRREFDHAIGSWPRGLSRAARADPVGGLVPGEHVANASDAAACVVGYGQSLERKWRPGAVSQKVFQTPKIVRHIAVDEGDPHTRVDGKPAVPPPEHVGSRRSVEQVSEPEPADHAAPYPLGDRGQISLRD